MHELVSIQEIVDNLDQYPQMAQEIRAAAESFAKEDRSFFCRQCGEVFIPAKGQWIFYNLCDACFDVFDYQKMVERMRLLQEWVSEGKDGSASY